MDKETNNKENGAIKDNTSWLIYIAKKFIELDKLYKRAEVILKELDQEFYGDGVDGTTSIVFIRMKEALEKPFITAELSENKLIQARGDHNGAPDNVDVLSFIKLWCKMSKIKNEIFT